jgi:hypothetical protein
MVNLDRNGILSKVGPCVGVCREMLVILIPTLMMLMLIAWLTYLFVS